MDVLVVIVLEPKITEKWKNSWKNRNLNMSVFYDMRLKWKAFKNRRAFSEHSEQHA